MSAGGLSYGAVKTEISTVVDNGISASETRVMTRTNEATRMLLDEGIWVNGMATYDIVATGTTLLLPKELENAIEAHPLTGTVNGQSDVKQGWFELVSNFVYLDPSQAHDNPLVDQFLVPDPGDATILRRQYDYPGLTPNATVRVTGAKRYRPITGDGDYLIVQNVRALKLAIISIELTEKNQPDEGEKYRQMALGLLQAEVRKHLLDPKQSMQRKYAYQTDLTTYAEGTLGRTRARLALELPGFLSKGKAEITYLINRAVQVLVDNRNELAIAGRIQVHNNVTELVYTPANSAGTALAWGDYNQIRLLVQGFSVEGLDPTALAMAQELQTRAFNLQHAQLIEATEKLRHTTYADAITSATVGSLDWFTARLALELPGGLQMTSTEIQKLIDRAQRLLIDNRNQLAIGGRISVHGTVTEIAYAAPVDGSSILQWGDYEQVKMVVQSLLSEPNDLALRQQAFNQQAAQLIEATEKARHTAYTDTLLGAVTNTFAWVVARLALELPNGIRLTTNELKRVAEMAEMRLMQRGTYKGTIEQFSAMVVQGTILFPAQVESILAADICGRPMPVRSIFFQYLENGPGMVGQCSSMLVDQGEVLMSNGVIRRKYKVLIGTGTEALTVVAKLRWIRKNDEDQMTIKNFEAIRLMSQAILDERSEKWKEASANQQWAIGVLETELKEYLAGLQIVMPSEPRSNFGLEDLGCPL